MTTCIIEVIVNGGNNLRKRVEKELKKAKKIWNQKEFLSAEYNYWHGYVRALEWYLANVRER